MDTNFKIIIAPCCYTFDVECWIIISDIIKDILIPTQCMQYLDYLSYKVMLSVLANFLLLITVKGVSDWDGAVELTPLPILFWGVVVGWDLE